jgi:uncharacterized protein (TIGR00255 family)
MNSMTGFGRAEITSPVGLVTVEIASVNNRYLELSLRFPRNLSSFEPQVRELISANLSRGQINVNITLDENGALKSRPVIDEKAAAAYTKQLREIQKTLKLSGDLSIHDLVLLPDIARSEKERVDLDALWKPIKKGLEQALVKLVAHRKSEGKAMAADMKKRLGQMTQVLGEIEKKAHASIAQYRERLIERVNDLLDASKRSNLRLEEEIALMAERTDITEECTRLRSHINLYQEAMKQSESAGKRLNFILQEMNREANTIGAKCSEFAVSSLAITLKEEVEKLRELVQNVE